MRISRPAGAFALLPLVLLCAGCGSADEAPPAAGLEEAFVAAAARRHVGEAPEAPTEFVDEALFRRAEAARRRYSPRAAREGLGGIGDAFLDGATRHPEVVAAERRLRAALESHDQARSLGELVGRFRVLTSRTTTAGGPPAGAGSKRPEAALLPWPAVEARRGELADREAEFSWHALRGTLAARAARALETEADREAEAAVLGILREQIAAQERLALAVEARVEAGRGGQPELLGVRARLASLRSRLAVQAERLAAAKAARDEALGLGADEDLPGPSPTLPSGPPAAPAVEETPGPAAAAAMLGRRRAAYALATVMVEAATAGGRSRFERERTGEAGAARGPDPFGLPAAAAARPESVGAGAALLEEARRRVEAAEADLEAALSATALALEEARAAWSIAAERSRLLEAEVLPLARGARDGRLGAFEAGRTGLAEVEESYREILELEMEQARARRAATRAAAAWMRASGRFPTP